MADRKLVQTVRVRDDDGTDHVFAPGDDVPSWAAELQPLRVNAVSPGVIATPWWDGVPAEQRAALWEQHAAQLPVKRVGQPEDVSQTILLLVKNTFMTGNIIACDGGARIG